MKDSEKKSLQVLFAGGLVETRSRVIVNAKTLPKVYSPGMAYIAGLIAEDNNLARKFTNLSNRVLVLSDGTACLGMGKVHPLAQKPVLESKSALYQAVAGVNATDIVVDNESSVDSIVSVVSSITKHNFSGVHIEDVAAPKCFELFEKLNNALDIPVFHDDRHCTAIAIVKFLKNYFKEGLDSLCKKNIVIWGAGAAGIGLAELLEQLGSRSVFVWDSQGLLSTQRSDLASYKQHFVVDDSEESILAKCDVFVALAKPDSVDSKTILSCTQCKTFLLLSNPTPDCDPKIVTKAFPSSKIVLGHPNEKYEYINNLSVFPGLMKSLLVSRSKLDTARIKDFVG